MGHLLSYMTILRLYIIGVCVFIDVCIIKKLVSMLVSHELVMM